MKQLIIAEKPSVAKTIATVLGVTDREDGYLSGNDYLVSWCFGHLAELADAEVYEERYAKWAQKDLPILPDPWQYVVSRDKSKQFALLRSLMNRSDVSTIINACDAGREGELIFRTVYNLAGCSKPMKRLWISSMEDSAIREGFANLRDGAEYDNLYASALCRSKADWTVGINATRLFSVLYHRTLNVGRVVSPTLALLVQREAEINAFQPEPFYNVVLNLPGFTAASEKMQDKADAEHLCENCTGENAAVVQVDCQEKSSKAPALYDLTTLQRDANRILGYTAQQTLDYLQALYEKKLCTYPRTDSRFLTDDMESSVPDLVRMSAEICGLQAPAVVITAQVCNSKKVSDHHAIVPTVSVKQNLLETLPAGEREILNLVARQVLMAVSSPCFWKETKAVLRCAGVDFHAKGKVILQKGWRIYSLQDQKDLVLPELIEGAILPVDSLSIKDGKTKAPAHFTEDTLLASMETAGREEMPEDAERKGLGTPATRAAVLEKLVSTGFVERQPAKKAVNLIPTSCGTSLITVLPEQLQSPLLTAEWEHKLLEIEKGELAPDTFLAQINAMVSELVDTYQTIPGADVLFPSGRPVVGKCPRCGCDVTESKKGYFCESNECRFGLWRDNRFLTGKKINLTKKMAASLLRDGKTFVSGIYSERTGKPYEAFVVLEDDGERTHYKLEFTTNK